MPTLKRIKIREVDDVILTKAKPSGNVEIVQ